MFDDVAMVYWIIACSGVAVPGPFLSFLFFSFLSFCACWTNLVSTRNNLPGLFSVLFFFSFFLFLGRSLRLFGLFESFLPLLLLCRAHTHCIPSERWVCVCLLSLHFGGRDSVAADSNLFAGAIQYLLRLLLLLLAHWWTHHHHRYWFRRIGGGVGGGSFLFCFFFFFFFVLILIALLFIFLLCLRISIAVGKQPHDLLQFVVSQLVYLRLELYFSAQTFLFACEDQCVGNLVYCESKFRDVQLVQPQLRLQ